MFDLHYVGGFFPKISASHGPMCRSELTHAVTGNALAMGGAAFNPSMPCIFASDQANNSHMPHAATGDNTRATATQITSHSGHDSQRPQRSGAGG
jgi:hypothetical protein